MTELLWFTVGGIEEEFGVLIKSLTFNLPFIYTKHTGSQAEDKHVINQLTFFFSSYSQWNPQNSFYFIFFPLFSFFSFIFLPLLQSPQVCISHFLFYITPLCSLQWKDSQKKKADRQTARREIQPLEGNNLGHPHSG